MKQFYYNSVYIVPCFYNLFMNKLLFIVILICAPTSTVTLIKKTKQATTVEIQNKCPGTIEKFLVESKIKENATGKLHELPPAEGDAYPLVICTDTQCYRYGNMTFLSGHRYIMKISQCNLPGVRVESHEVTAVTSTLPVAIRFRSRRVSPIEYRYDQTRFRRLSVGMSKYWNIPWPLTGGSVNVQFRHRIISDGPVSYKSTHELTSLKPGHKYFIEVEYFGEQKEFIKIQDEGLNTVLAK